MLSVLEQVIITVIPVFQMTKLKQRAAELGSEVCLTSRYVDGALLGLPSAFKIKSVVPSRTFRAF